MRPPLTLLLIPLLFAACHSFSEKSLTNPSQLTEHSIYDLDSVRMVADAGNENAARKRLLTAIDIYKNVKDPEKSIAIFKSSIRLKPTANAYFELGSALLDIGQYEESAKALRMAEKLEYSPLANVMFKLAAACSKMAPNNGYSMYSKSEDLHYMEVALQMGYAHPEQFLNAELFSALKSNSNFYTIYNAAVSGSESTKDPEQRLWKTFAAESPELELPLIINREWIGQHKLDNAISFEYEKFIPEMRNAKFERESSTEYYYVGIVKKDPAFTALLYAAREGDSDGFNSTFFYLVSFTPGGKIIDKIQAAGQDLPASPFKVFTLQKNYAFEIRDFKDIREKDPEQAGYDSNPVIRSEPLTTANYRIAANGKFEKIDAPLAMR
jgi:tetratricopeptide (TPR) repeat protein